MSKTQGSARDATSRLVLASREFLDAFVSWEAATHLDFGGGVQSADSRAPLSQQVQELVEGAASMESLNDELRDLLHQVTHRLSTRGFVGKEGEVG